MIKIAAAFALSTLLIVQSNTARPQETVSFVISISDHERGIILRDSCPIVYCVFDNYLFGKFSIALLDNGRKFIARQHQGGLVAFSKGDIQQGVVGEDEYFHTIGISGINYTHKFVVDIN